MNTDGNSFKFWFDEYIRLQQKLLLSITPEQLDKLIHKVEYTFHNKNKIFICGNGGSLSNAQHFICDLNKGAAYCLNVHILGHALGSNPSLSSAIANDYSYEDIFVEELISYDKNLENNLLIGISVSGNSPNVVKAMEYAKKTGMHTVAITGNNGKNKLAELAEYTIGLDSKHFGRVEDITMTILHMVCYWFMERKKDVS